MKIAGVKVLDGYRLHLRFEDGVEGDVDLCSLAGKGVFELWNDYEEFRRVQLTDFGGLQWGEDIDLCPDALYLEVTGKTPQDLFPNLKKSASHA